MSADDSKRQIWLNMIVVQSLANEEMTNGHNEEMYIKKPSNSHVFLGHKLCVDACYWAKSN